MKKKWMFILKVILTIAICSYCFLDNKIILKNFITIKALTLPLLLILPQLLVHFVAVSRLVLLLGSKGVPSAFWNTFRLTWAAQFFSLILPNLVGTDLIKFYGLSNKENRKKVAYIIIADRVLSLASLVLLGLFFWLLSFYNCSKSVLFVLVMLTILTPLFFYKLNSQITRAISLSFLAHLTKIAMIIGILYIFYSPLGIKSNLLSKISGAFLIESLPISFAGLGIGHLAFGELLEKYAIDGVFIYNIYFTSSILFKIAGGILGRISKE